MYAYIICLSTWYMCVFINICIDGDDDDEWFSWLKYNIFFLCIYIENRSWIGKKMERTNEYWTQQEWWHNAKKKRRKLKTENNIFIGNKVELVASTTKHHLICRFNGAHSNRTIDPNKTQFDETLNLRWIELKTLLRSIESFGFKMKQPLIWYRCMYDCTVYDWILPSSEFEILASFQLDIQKLFTLNWTFKQNVTTFCTFVLFIRSQWTWIFGIIWECFFLNVHWIYIYQNESNMQYTINVRTNVVRSMYGFSCEWCLMLIEKSNGMFAISKIESK